ncbi:hypothetical protein HOP50_03g21080 [Chloropicon primus]|uniref:Uncharacterized protein n=2 Tax=Chloropicon primus TaxID=1764295 RepID=A0A5B8MJM2_9CHLO|nr:hypothetical protein A3770_03p21080 [Chloropicon primus]UPQ98802.1 hypothetical protein HOP50_03g21080 [Chloropicon primus]|eukprot:QDZ19590.1 hypothetical protein A3770_03p21080 [Chloropicon primus]
MKMMKMKMKIQESVASSRATSTTCFRGPRAQFVGSACATRLFRPSSSRGADCRRHQNGVFVLAVSTPSEEGVGSGTGKSSSSLSSLESLPMKSVISVEGEVHPDEAEGVQASVFAVFDQAKQLQFVGFSKHLRNSLRTILGRQSDLAYYYKHVDLPEVNQEKMMGIRDAWFKENSGMPLGNTSAKVQFWQQPLVAGGVSEKGKQVAASQMLETIMKRLTQRGLREEFLVNEDLLKEGKVDFLPAKELTEEEKRLKKEMRQKVLEATRTCSTVVDGNQEEFLLFFQSVFEANGGAMVDVSVTKDDVATDHRVIIGEDYLQALAMPVKDIVERTVSFLLSKKVSRKTEGILNSNEFPINYFALSTVEQFFGDFAVAFEDEDCLPGEDKFWRFNRIHTYGWNAHDEYKK